MLSKLNIFKTSVKPPTSSPGGVAAQSSRPMKFPYTFSAKIAQFPFKFYYNNNWIVKYYVFGVMASIPVFFYIHTLSNSPANKEKWAEIRRKEAEEYAHKHS